MRSSDKDQEWLKQVVVAQGLTEAVYISHNHYDGGYEIRVGSKEVFVDYETIDAKEVDWVKSLA